MSFPEYKPYPLELVIPDFDSEITDLIISLDLLRKGFDRPPVHPMLFEGIVQLFHTVESVGSARIEGNNTGIVELIESGNTDPRVWPEGVREIKNLEQTLAYIDREVDQRTIDSRFVLELHERIMEGLQPPPMGDGDPDAGRYRQEEVGIGHSTHLPPPPWEVKKLMESMFEFLAERHPRRFDLIKAAITHHRFVWIHPFMNGNGRTARMFTYAVLIKLGFRVNLNRILHPTAVFCSDRRRYYEFLAKADEGNREGILQWSHYMLGGLDREIKKTDKLADHHFLRSRILDPSIDHLLKRGLISAQEARLLKICAEKGMARAADFSVVFKDRLPQEVSRQVRRLREKGLIVPDKEGGRKYLLNIRHDELRLGLMNALDREGFLPE
jgi:Fic family protein